MGRTCGFDNSCLVHMIPVLTAVFGFVTSIVASFWCETIQMTPHDEWPDNLSLEPVSFGLWKAQEHTVETIGGITHLSAENSCVDYNHEWDIDSHWKTARAFSVIAPIVGGLCVIPLFFAPIGWYPSQKVWKSLGPVFVMVTLSQGLTFLIFQSNICNSDKNTLLHANDFPEYFNKDCEWNGGSSANVASTVLWFITTVLVLGMDAPTRPQREAPMTQDIIYVKREDGTIEEVQGSVLTPMDA